MSKGSDKLTRARHRVANSLTELARAEAKQEQREGARDTKRKILLGAAAEVMMRADANLRARFASFMPEFLKRRTDLDVFDLGGEKVSYFERLAAPADAEVDAAVSLLGEPDPHLGATKRQPAPTGSAQSRVSVPPSGANATGGGNGAGPRPPPLPNPMPSSSS